MPSSMMYSDSDEVRWTAKRKAEIIEAIRTGKMGRKAALQVYDLTLEELEQWERLYEADNIKALRATRLQVYRNQAKKAIK